MCTVWSVYFYTEVKIQVTVTYDNVTVQKHNINPQHFMENTANVNVACYKSKLCLYIAPVQLTLGDCAI